MALVSYFFMHPRVKVGKFAGKFFLSDAEVLTFELTTENRQVVVNTGRKVNGGPAIGLSARIQAA